MLPFKNMKVVPAITFAKGSIQQLPALIAEKQGAKDVVVYIIDHFFKDRDLIEQVRPRCNDLIFYLDTTHEPETETINRYGAEIKAAGRDLPVAIVGIGGGSTLDVAKAVAITLTNPGKVEGYQGWNLVKIPPVYKIGVPTLSGTGSEVSRTTVLTSPTKKQGINSDFSIFDQIILDPELLVTVPREQRFYTGMDCYIHCVESLCGTYLNEFSHGFASKALELCKQVFINDGADADLMVASFMGGYAIVYSEVGICHALSYGISWAFGYHHGEANSIVFNYLEDFYSEHVQNFKKMLALHQIQLPHHIAPNIDPALLEKMVDITLLMEKPLQNALGPDWRSIMTRDRIKELYHCILES
ncbi:iron-containing alcohol dehydrogenase family protein [candidate division KSB1 bacterium]|nr:iron-containing alcohol dehydrogenase family protein [candidate division KSB1 bacterium]